MDEPDRTGVDPDVRVVSACQKGDVNAFGVLVEKYQKQMFNIAFRMCGDYEEACEIVQDAFLSAFRSIKKFRAEARFSTWMCAITINHARNHIKEMKRRSYHEPFSFDDPSSDEDQQAVQGLSDQPSVVEELEKMELQEKVQECIGRLAPEHREVVILRDMQGFSYEEISDILSIPDGTVKSRLFRARDVLKDLLKKVFDRV